MQVERARPRCRRRFADVLLEVLISVVRPIELLVASRAKCRQSRRRFLLSLFENATAIR